MRNIDSQMNPTFFEHRNYINVKIKQPSSETNRKKTAILTNSIHPVDVRRQVADLLTTFIPHLSFIKCLILITAFSSIFLRKVFNLSLLFSSILPSARVAGLR